MNNISSALNLILLGCILCLISPVSGFAQIDNRIEKRIIEIRAMYDRIRSGELEKINLQDSQVMYFDGGRLVRTEFFDPEGEIRYDFYYDNNEELFFAFSNDKKGLENRYYYSTEVNGLLNIRIPVLIKWLDGEKKSITDLDAGFEEKGFEILQKSIDAKSRKPELTYNEELARLDRDEICEMIENEMTRIDLSMKYLLESINLLEDDDENEYCTEEINKYSVEGDDKMVYKVYIESCDPGCMVVTGIEEHEYFNNMGYKILTIFEESIMAYSSEKILYNSNRVEVIKQNYIFYDNGKEIHKQEVMKINDYKIY